MSPESTIAGPHARLLDWLAANHVDHALHEHSLTFTAQATARAEGVDPRTFAKVVAVRTESGQRAFMVLDAPDHLDLHKARDVLGGGRVHLLTETELVALAPECEAGAIPAVGALYDLPMYADHAVREAAHVSFNAGSHRYAVRVDRADWERASAVVYADLAEDEDLRPAWARS